MSGSASANAVSSDAAATSAVVTKSAGARAATAAPTPTIPGAGRGLADLAELERLLHEDGSLATPVLRRRDAAITGLADDSRDVRPDTVFFAVPGLVHDGAAYAEAAVAAGAVAIVACRPVPVPVPVFLVPDVRRAASLAAAAFYGRPSTRMPVVGVTGTNGKTTTTELLALCFEDEFGAVGSLGTVRYRLGPSLPGEDGGAASSLECRDHEIAASHTTPGPIAIQRYLADMRRRNVQAAVLEVSSHALDQGRVHAVQFAAAVLTNLTQDHLDYHGDMASYAAAKARLFASLPPGAVAVLPYDDEVSLRMLAALAPGVRVIGYGKGPLERSPLAEHVHQHVRVERLDGDPHRQRLLFSTPEGCTEIELPLLGEHNVRNAAAALACAIGLGIGALRASDSLSRARPVAGRLEEIGAGELPFRVYVDYAHTPDALERVLRTGRALCSGRLHVLFGCGGDRDRKKRPLMGAAACRGADHVVLTQDNPRREDPEEIVRQILAGMTGLEEPGAPSVEICHDRRRAIDHVLAEARAGDVVLIAGKGHETGQVLGTRTVPFDDRAEVRAWIAARARGGAAPRPGRARSRS